MLSNQGSRNDALAQIKHLLRNIDIELSNKLMPLVYEIYLDAQYKERTNLHMKTIIIDLQDQVAELEQRSRKQPETPIDLVKGKFNKFIYSEPEPDQNTISAYQRINLLASTLERVERENVQLRN